MLKAISIKQNSSITLDAEKHGFVYFYKGDAVLNEKTELPCGNAVYFDSCNPITILAKSQLKIVHISIQ
jgi:hypothetical protein